MQRILDIRGLLRQPAATTDVGPADRSNFHSDTHDDISNEPSVAVPDREGKHALSARGRGEVEW